MAQSYAEECRGLSHSSSAGRWTKRFGSCGENIFIATHKVPWHFAIKSWFSEKDLFNYGCGGNNLTQVREERAECRILQVLMLRSVTTLRWSGAPVTSWAAGSPSVLGQRNLPGGNTTLTSVTTVLRELNCNVVRISLSSCTLTLTPITKS